MLAHATGFALLTVAISIPAAAQDDTDGDTAENHPGSGWISISGTVVAPDSRGFSLDYGDGTIRVEMPESAPYQGAYEQMEGDHARIYGYADADFFERDTIDAHIVYNEDLATYFHGEMPGGTESIASYFWQAPGKLEINQATVRGTVISTNPAHREFILDTGEQQLRIETEGLRYDPLDELGYQQLEAGDVVSVTGDFDSDMLEGLVLDANRIISLGESTPGESVAARP